MLKREETQRQKRVQMQDKKGENFLNGLENKNAIRK